MTPVRFNTTPGIPLWSSDYDRSLKVQLIMVIALVFTRIDLMNRSTTLNRLTTGQESSLNSKQMISITVQYQYTLIWPTPIKNESQPTIRKKETKTKINNGW
eukprot:43014_1